MITLRSALLPAIDLIRGIPDTLGLRLFTVQVVTRVWTGARVGLGTKTDTYTQLHTNAGTQGVKVRCVSEKDVIASGGLYTADDIVVGPLTPEVSSDNTTTTAFDPPVTGKPTEILFIVTGPGYSANGDWFRKISQEVSRVFTYTLVLRKYPAVAP